MPGDPPEPCRAALGRGPPSIYSLPRRTQALQGTQAGARARLGGGLRRVPPPVRADDEAVPVVAAAPRVSSGRVGEPGRIGKALVLRHVPLELRAAPLPLRHGARPDPPAAGAVEDPVARGWCQARGAVGAHAGVGPGPAITPRERKLPEGPHHLTPCPLSALRQP